MYLTPRWAKRSQRQRDSSSFAFELDYFHPNDKGITPIPAQWVKGTGNFVVVLGENASGKSFLRRIVSALARKAEVEVMPISMEGRGQEFGGLRGFVYGSEEWQSTGENSSHTVLTGISTCRSRATPHVIFWDEPDLGLSDGWAAGMGETFLEFAQDLPKMTCAAFVVTHSRALVERLVPANPHYLYLGSDVAPPTLRAWLDKPVVARPLATLKEESHQRFRLIDEILKTKKR